jgi:hypothetical protein
MCDGIGAVATGRADPHAIIEITPYLEMNPYLPGDQSDFTTWIQFIMRTALHVTCLTFTDRMLHARAAAHIGETGSSEILVERR